MLSTFVYHFSMGAVLCLLRPGVLKTVVLYIFVFFSQEDKSSPCDIILVRVRLKAVRLIKQLILWVNT